MAIELRMNPKLMNISKRRENIKCLNCGLGFVGSYCPDCGQSASTTRFTWHEIWHHTTHALAHVDSGAFFTLIQLVKAPGHTIRDYLDGKRRPYFNPFTLLLTTTAICSLLYVHYGVKTQLEDITLNTYEESTPTIVHKYFAIRSVFLILICTLGDGFFFPDGKYKLPEMVISNTYQFGVATAAQVVCIPIFLWSEGTGWGPWARSVFILCVLAYLFWTRWQFLRAGRDPALNLRITLVLVVEFAIVALAGRWVVKPFLVNMHH
jgi:hypothetical protein